MCGIAGMLRLDGAPAPLDLVERAAALLAHRGPDAAGSIQLGPAALAHRRLSIIDTSPGAHQPLANEDGRVQVVFNGEMYNFADLRATLESHGHRFRTRSDTEVIVHAWEQWGRACVERFNGMFAIALYDAREATLLVARDRLGVKPLFYATRGPVLAFGSEIKAVAAQIGEASLDACALYDYFAHNYVPGPRTALREVASLPPGHLLIAGPGRPPRLEAYWAPPPWGVSDQDVDLLQWVREIEQLVDDAVRCRLVADVPLGAFLSGGIDSSAVVATMARAAGPGIKTFAVGFDEASHDEGAYARSVARAVGTDHQVVTCRAGDVPDLVSTVAWHADNLTADVSLVPIYLLARLARRHVKVVLSGDGGDEVFGGYPTYQADRAAAVYRHLPPWIRGVAAGLARRLPPSTRKMSVPFVLRRFTDGAGAPAVVAHASWRRIFSDAERDELLAPDLLDAVRGHDSEAPFVDAFERAEAATDLDRLFYVDVKTFLPDSILPKVDTMTLAHGLEAREPLLDHRLVELGARLPWSVKLRGRHTKWIFKRAMAARVPPAIVRRAKAGFQPPFSAWFRGPLSGFVRESLATTAVREAGLLRPEVVQRYVDDHLAGRADHGLKLWSLLFFVAWMRHDFAGRRTAAALVHA